MKKNLNRIPDWLRYIIVIPLSFVLTIATISIFAFMIGYFLEEDSLSYNIASMLCVTGISTFFFFYFAQIILPIKNNFLAVSILSTLAILFGQYGLFSILRGEINNSWDVANVITFFISLTIVFIYVYYQDEKNSYRDFEEDDSNSISDYSSYSDKSIYSTENKIKSNNENKSEKNIKNQKNIEKIVLFKNSNEDYSYIPKEDILEFKNILYQIVLEIGADNMQKSKTDKDLKFEIYNSFISSYSLLLSRARYNKLKKLLPITADDIDIFFLEGDWHSDIIYYKIINLYDDEKELEVLITEFINNVEKHINVDLNIDNYLLVIKNIKMEEVFYEIKDLDLEEKLIQLHRMLIEEQNFSNTDEKIVIVQQYKCFLKRYALSIKKDFFNELNKIFFEHKYMADKNEYFYAWWDSLFYKYVSIMNNENISDFNDQLIDFVNNVNEYKEIDTDFDNFPEFKAKLLSDILESKK